MHDLVIRGGTVVDGSGDPPRSADVAIDGTRITAVGDVQGAGDETLDAHGLLVTPGFVDVHTHYDGQATWDPELAPSCWHGVTTVVFGNCGVGFAPARRDRHEWLIGLMEGVEDIPGAALSAGIRWDWETFPEYLDALARMPRVLDIGAQVPHGALRAYVMGERGAANEPATADDIATMERLVREALEAGALGFTTSRTAGHRGVDGRPVPGTFAREDELVGIGKALATAGRGVFEVAEAGTGGHASGDPMGAAEAEVAWMARLSAAIKRPVSFSLRKGRGLVVAPCGWCQGEDEIPALSDLSAHHKLPSGRGSNQEDHRPSGRSPRAAGIDHVRRVDETNVTSGRTGSRWRRTSRTARGRQRPRAGRPSGREADLLTSISRGRLRPTG